MAKKIKKDPPAEIPGKITPPEIQDPEPEKKIVPEEDPEIIPFDDPFEEIPPDEKPPPGEKPSTG